MDTVRKQAGKRVGIMIETDDDGHLEAQDRSEQFWKPSTGEGFVSGDAGSDTQLVDTEMALVSAVKRIKEIIYRQSIMDRSCHMPMYTQICVAIATTDIPHCGGKTRKFYHRRLKEKAWFVYKVIILSKDNYWTACCCVFFSNSWETVTG